MKEIKKVTSDDAISMDEIRAGALPVSCDDVSCHLQCTCDFAGSADQYVLARGYYQTHSAIWN